MVKHEETVGQHDQSQMAMQSLPTAPLEVIQTTFPLGIFIKLLDDPPRVGKKKSPVGVTRSGVVYELFFTNLSQRAFSAAIH